MANTPTSLLVVAPQPVAGTCATLVLEAQPRAANWRGLQPGRLLEGLPTAVAARKPWQAATPLPALPERA